MGVVGRIRSSNGSTNRHPATVLLSREQALRADDPLLRLQAHALDAIVALIPAPVAIFARVTRRRSIAQAVGLVDGANRAALERYWQLPAGPFGPRAFDAPNTTVLALEHVAARAREYAAELREAGWDDRLSVYLRLAGTTAGIVSLLRPRGGPPFAAADITQLRRIHPLLEHVYGCALEPGGDSPRDVLRRGGLTPREIDVAALVGRGASNAEIARSLHVTEATVKTHLTRVYAKVGVRTRTQLALLMGGGA